MTDLLVWPGLVLLGMLVGGYGTLIGAGGGFILVPVLLLLFPDKPPELITSISLGAVFFNALSGSLAYIRQHRVDFLAGNFFAAATIPGAILGALATGYVPRDLFDAVFGILLLVVAFVLIRQPEPRVVGRVSRQGETSRLLTDSHGDTYFYSYNVKIGVILSLGIGFIASALGIGGGLIHVPLLIQVLHFPALIATATSQYVLMITSATSASVHLITGHYEGGYAITAALAVGVVLGAQVGAAVSAHLKGAVIVRLMAAALILLAVRLLMGFVF
jgi:uncharacterized membrane protein YfcA